MKLTFPEGFLFGAASSAVQIESAPCEDGKGVDAWQHFSKVYPEKFLDGDPQNGADFYHRYKEDIKLMKELGLKSFRFSIAWSRIYPNGPDKINQAGIDYYHNLFDELIKNDIVPLIDLWHCDLPMWIYDRGGVCCKEFIDWYLIYAKTCFTEYGHKVPYWSTVNEPQCNVMAGYAWGNQPPFEKDIKKSLQASHNMIITHFKTVKLYREMGLPGKIGFVNHFQLAYGASLDEKDQAAADRDMAFYSNWYSDAIFLGRYPQEVFDYPYIKDIMPKDYQKDLDENFIKTDFIGINYYGAYRVKYEKNDVMDYATIKGEKKDAYGFTINTGGIFDVVKYVHDKYPDAELFISENGISRRRRGYSDDPEIENSRDTYEQELEDDYRITYMREHLRGVSRLISEGYPVKGYYHWTIMDTTEGMNGGYSLTFGLIQIRFDKPEKPRTPKKSYYYYQSVIKHNAVD